MTCQRCGNLISHYGEDVDSDYDVGELVVENNSLHIKNSALEAELRGVQIAYAELAAEFRSVRDRLSEDKLKIPDVHCRRCGRVTPGGWSGMDSTLCGPCYNRSGI